MESEGITGKHETEERRTDKRPHGPNKKTINQTLSRSDYNQPAAQHGAGHYRGGAADAPVERDLRDFFVPVTAPPMRTTGPGNDSGES